jgi:hypothetical protein
MPNSEGSIEKLVSNDVNELGGLTPRRSRFDPAPVHVGFIVDKVAEGQVLLQVLRLSHATIIPPPILGNLEAT